MQVQVIMFIKYDTIMGPDTDICSYIRFEIIYVLKLNACFAELLRNKCHPAIGREDLQTSFKVYSSGHWLSPKIWTGCAPSVAKWYSVSFTFLYFHLVKQ